MIDKNGIHPPHSLNAQTVDEAVYFLDQFMSECETQELLPFDYFTKEDKVK